MTHALLFGSPAIDMGDPSFGPPPEFDQRGAPFSRVFDGRIDMGSYERQTGDMDVDGDGDFDDIGGLVLGMTEPENYEILYGAPPNANGDMDADGDQDFDDIPLFVTMLSGGSDPLLGDLDLDDDVDFDDIDAFAMGLTDVAQYEAIYGVSPAEAGDTDDDSDFDFDDIPGFVDLLIPGLAATTSGTVRASLDMTGVEHDRADGKVSTETGREGSSGNNLLRPTRLPLESLVKKSANASPLRSASATSSRGRELHDDELATIWSGDVDWRATATAQRQAGSKPLMNADKR